MTKKELVERIAEGSPVFARIPFGKKTRYAALDTEALVKMTLKRVRGNTELPCEIVSPERTRKETRGWMVFWEQS